MKSNTERKLAEARFFLDKLNPNDPYFDYFLSAYLNASRSTTWIMRNEFQGINGWEEWFKSCKVSTEEKKLLKEINDLRILSTKQSGIKTEFYFADGLIPDEEYYPIISKMLDELEGERVVITLSSEEENTPVDEGSYRIRGKVKMEKDKSSKSREAIYDLCQAYFSFLEKQVSACVEKFSLNRRG